MSETRTGAYPYTSNTATTWQAITLHRCTIIVRDKRGSNGKVLRERGICGTCGAAFVRVTNWQTREVRDWRRP